MAGTTLPNGQILPPPTAMYTPPTQNVQGGPLNAAADKTIEANHKQAEIAAKMGAGQKGSGRRRKFRRGGSSNLNAPASLLPTAGSIPGVDPTDTHIRAVDIHNKIVADAAGDKLSTAAPYYPAKTGGKRTKRKSKHGRRNNRTHRRGNRKSTHGRGRTRRRV